MRKFIILIALLIPTLTQAKVTASQDSLYRSFQTANRALREYGFKVVEAKEGKMTILEKEIMGEICQVVLERKRKRISADIYTFYNYRKSWGSFKTIEKIEDGVIIIIKSSQEDGSVDPLLLVDTPFWSTVKKEIKE